MQTNVTQSPQSSPSPAAIGALTQRVETLTRDVGWYDRWKDRLDILSVALLAAAFVLGFVGNRLGARLNRANKDLLVSKEQLSALQIATVEANARTEAKRVEGEAGKKIEDAKAESGVKIEQAKAEAARQVGAVQKDVARQQERAAIAETELIKLKERIAPRRLTTAQAVSLKAVLSGDPHRVFVVCKLLDPESCEFASDIAAVFAEAGWDVLKNNTSLNSFPGVVVFANKSTNTLRSQTIFSAFKRAGIVLATTYGIAPNSIGTWPEDAEDRILVIVGIKPILD